MSNLVESELNTDVKVTVTIVPFGTFLIESSRVEQRGEDPRLTHTEQGLYSFPSETARIEPTVFATDTFQVV